MAFGGAIKLTGENEYKKALSEITGGLKVLSSEMQVVTAQYGKSDASIEGATAKNKVLNEQIDKQKDKVNVLKDALEKAKEETGENSSVSQKWQTELNKAEANLITMNKEVEANAKIIEEDGKANEEASEKIDKFGNSTTDALTKSDVFWASLKANLSADFIKAGLQALANGITNVASAFSDSLSDGAKYADDILTLSNNTGIATKTLQEYSAVSELIDVSTETLTSSMAKNIKMMSSGNEAYKKLGIDVKDVNGNLRDGEAVYWEAIDALGTMTNETERDALAMEIFGKKAQDLNSLIAIGSEGFNDLKVEAQKMGAVLSDEGLQALGALDDEMQKSATITKATSNIMASAFAPAVTSMMGGLNDIGGAFNNLIANILNGDEGSIDEAMSQFSATIETFINNIGEQVPKMLEIGTNLITKLLTAITDNLPRIMEAGINVLTNLLSGITNNLSQILPVVISAIMTLVNGLIANLPTIIDAGMQILLALIMGIAESLPELIPTIVDAVITITETLIENIDLIIDAGIAILFGLIEGIIKALPRLIDKIPEIIDKLIIALTNNLPKLIEAGIQLTISLSIGLIKAVPQLISKLPQIITSIASGLLSGIGKISDVGKNLVEGLWNGINDAKDWVLDKIKGFSKAILKGIKSFFGINSPSRVFKDEIGKNLALGVGEGFSDEMSTVVDEMQDALPKDFDLGVTTSLSNDISSNIASSSALLNDDRLIYSLQEALKGMAFEVDGNKMGELVISEVEKVVYS